MGGAGGSVRASARWQAAARLALALVAAVVLGGCRADLVVEVDAGSGPAGQVRATVTLDREAAAQVPDLARQLPVDDLEGAGWEVAGPDPAPGGGLTVSAAKRFASTAEAARAIEELSGAGGPFSSLRLTRRRGFWKTATALSGTVDLRGGIGAFGDPALAELLGGPNLGLDPAGLEQELGRPLAEMVGVELVGRLPGTVRANAPGRRDGAPAWAVPLGGTATVAASSEAWNTATAAAVAGAALLAVALVVALAWRRARRRAGRR